MSNRKYPRLSDGYHDRSPYHPYQTKKQANCIADSRDRDRSPSGSNSKDSSPYFSNRHSNLSPRTQRSKYSYSRSKDGSKKGSSISPNDAHSESNSHSAERRTKLNHTSVSEEFPWSQHISSSGKVYYYNFKTEKSQWEKPKEWIERERKEKEGKDRIRSSVSNKDTGLRKDNATYDKSRTYVSKHSFKDSVSNDKKDSTRLCIDERGRENHQVTESDRGQMVVKTISAYTSAQSTISHRSTPLAAVNSDVSPAGSLQDVSPPSTPSSRASIFDTGSHSSSPQLVSISPLGTPYQNSQSPLGLSRHGMLLQVSSSCPLNSHYTKPLHSVAQPLYNSAQYGLVNNGITMNILTPSQLKTAYDGDVNSRPAALHPLQQATLLHQKKLSESCNHAISNYQQPFNTATQPTPQTAATALLKDSSRINQSPGSPIVLTPTSVTSTQNAKESLPHIQTSAPNSAQTSPSSVSPVPLQSSPVVTLQAFAKYVDKSLINHTINWPTEAIDKQVQRLNDEGCSSSSEASKIQIQQLHLNSQLDLLDITLNVGSKRISSMKEVTKTLEKLLAESDKKSLT